MTDRVLGTKTAKVWKDRGYLGLPEDNSMYCHVCKERGAIRAPLVTWVSYMYFQVGSDPVGEVRDNLYVVLCKEHLMELYRELEEAGDFHDEFWD